MLQTHTHTKDCDRIHSYMLFLSHSIQSLKNYPRWRRTDHGLSWVYMMSYVLSLCHCMNVKAAQFIHVLQQTQDTARYWANRGDTEIVLVSVTASSTRIRQLLTNPTEGWQDDLCTDLWGELWQRCTFLKTKAQLGSSIALLKWFCCKIWQSIWFELIIFFLRQWAKTSIVEYVSLNLCRNYTAIIRVIDESFQIVSTSILWFLLPCIGTLHSLLLFLFDVLDWKCSETLHPPVWQAWSSYMAVQISVYRLFRPARGGLAVDVGKAGEMLRVFVLRVPAWAEGRVHVPRGGIAGWMHRWAGVTAVSWRHVWPPGGDRCRVQPRSAAH